MCPCCNSTVRLSRRFRRYNKWFLHWKFTVGDYVLIVRYCVVFVTGRRGFGPGEQEFGYVHVRPGAHMFYWLYYTTAPRDWSETPLVMWLQGGPGASSTSHGNFETIGPLTTDLERRNSSWVGALKSEKRTLRFNKFYRWVAQRRLALTAPHELPHHFHLFIFLCRDLWQTFR